MKKRYVQVTIKATGRVTIFPTVARMFMLLGEDAIGVKINSLWNALSRHKGKYENSKVKVEYKEAKTQVWE